MSGRTKTSDHTAWRQLLDLGKQLMVHLSVAAQRELIEEAAARLIGGNAKLWLSEIMDQLVSTEAPSSPPNPPSALMRRALQTRQLVSSTTAESDGAWAIAAPLLAQDTVLGVLALERADGSSFSDDEMALLDGLATQSTITLQAAREVAIERWRAEQLALVRAVSAQVANVLDLDELCRRVTDLILRTFDYYYVALFTLEPGQEILLHRASAGPRRAEVDTSGGSPTLTVQLGQGIIGHAAQAGEEILTNDVSQEARYQHVDSLPETRSEVALPLQIKSRVLGVLDVQSDRTERFDATDLLVLRALADQIAIAVQDARLYSDLRRRADQLSAVTEVSRAVASILTLDDLFDEVVTLIHEQFDYPFVHIFTIDPSRGRITYRAGSDPSGEALHDKDLACSLDEPERVIPWVACHGETVLINDARSDPRYRPSPLLPHDARAQLAVPLIFGGKVLGVLDVQSERPRAFGDEDRLLFEALADNVAIAIRNANLYRSERWRRQVAESLQEVAGLLSAGVDLEQVLHAILAELERNLPCDAAAIWLLRNGDLCLSAVHGYAAEVCVSGLPLDASSWLHLALDADEPLVRTAESSPEPLGASLEFPSDYSAIAAPLRVGDQRLGVLTLAHRTSGRYGAESRAMTAAFASYAAVAIENTRLYQAAQEQAYISTVLLQVAEAIQSLTSLDDVLGTVVRLVPMLIGVERCAMFLWDESDETFVPATACGLDSGQERAFNRWRIAPSDAPGLDRLRLTREPIFLNEETAGTLLPCPLGSALDFRSPLLLPLLAHGEMLGAMLVDYQSDEPAFGRSREFDEEKLVILRGIAYQTAAAAENARLLEAREEEAYVSAALLQVAQAVVNSNELDDVLSAIIRITPMLVGVERCIILLWDDERQAFAVAQAYGLPHDAERALLDRRYAPEDFPLLDAIREFDETIILESPDDWGRLAPSGFAADFLAPSEGKDGLLLAVPLSVKDDTLGAMLIKGSGPSRSFGSRRLEIITGIAQQTALAVQNDRLQQERNERQRLERELQLAREIQQTFMPSELPHLSGWDLAVTWRAARQVAGDFYDVFELPGRRLGMVIADVADKGMPAALFMALTRTLMRAAALEERAPANVMARVNDLLIPDAQHGMFVTAIYAILSLETEKLTYANAGHPPPLLRRSATGDVESLDKGGIALGVLENVQFEDRVMSVEPGDYVIFYTDGVTEALSPEGKLYGEKNFRATVQSTTADSAQTMLDAIIDAVITFVGDAPPSDDLTATVLHRLKQ